MRIAIYGLGYVGTVSAGCLSALGHDVVGVDVNPDKVEAIRGGNSPIVEAGVPELLAAAVAEGRLSATTDQAEAAQSADVSLVCVGTPSGRGGGTDTTFVHSVARTIAEARAAVPGRHVIAIRSTVPPGTVAAVTAIVAAAGCGDRVGVAANPEFLREGSAVADFNAPPFTVIGSDDPNAAATLAAVYADLDAPVRQVSVGVAELIKYASNAFHATKVAFANEVGALCGGLGVDGQELMALFCEDTQLNASGAYLRPGMAYGGSCLPKDVRGLAHQLRHADLVAPLLGAVETSNAEHMQRALDLVLAARPRRVGLLGLAFKAGTDDVRESPAVRLAEQLIGRGLELSIFDANVRYAALVGANRRFLDSEIPHITAYLRESPADAVRDANVVVISQWSREFANALADAGPETTVVDTVGIPAGARAGRFCYRGLCW